MAWMTTTDLGFTLCQSQPGSTAKLITSMASFNKLGLAAANKNISMWHRGNVSVPKVLNLMKQAVITLERAVAKSNNVYFIKLANQEHLEGRYGHAIPMKTGMFLHGVGGYYFSRGKKNTCPGRKMAAICGAEPSLIPSQDTTLITSAAHVPRVYQVWHGGRAS
jgi:membrane peptidoglycan carboxypeptidase